MPVPAESFPARTEISVSPGDSFVDLKWTPLFKEDVKKPWMQMQGMQMPGGQTPAIHMPGMQTPGMEKGLRKETTPEEREIAGYIILYGKESKNYSAKIDVGNITSYRLRGLNNYTTYFFAIQAYTKTREFSLPSQEVAAIPKEERDLLSPVEKSFSEEKVPQTISREVRQFGYEFFQSKVSSFAPGADIPVGPDYIIGPGDAFNISLWGRIEGSFAVEVDRNGQIALPKVGVLKVWGLTFSQLQKALFDHISQYYKDFQMNVAMERLRTIRVFVVGEAQNPGNYVLSSLSTINHALIAAGGPSKRGSLRAIQHLRNGTLLDTVDLYDFFLRGDRSKDVRLQSGDTIFIPIIAATAGISGSVKRPAIYELKGPISLGDFIQMAGGVSFQGYLQRVQVERIDAHQKKIAIDFDLSSAGPNPSPQLNSLLQDGDFVKIFPVYHRPENIVFLEGNVKRPGAYELKPGMKLSDLIPSYEAFPSEPYLEHGEIHRLVPPEEKLKIVSFHLGKFLQGDPEANLSLENRDRVIIYERSSLSEIPRTSISGEVQAPGKYRLAEKMRIKDLVYQAGNVKRSAYLHEAEITRLIKTEKGVSSRIINIDLLAALKDNPQHNIVLEEDDHLFVRQIPKWYVDKTVSVAGEVKFPGSYTFQKGDRLSSVLERAGGFTREAFLPAAVFTRESVRKTQEKRIVEFIQEQEQEIVKEAARATEGALSKDEAEQRQKALEQRRQLISRLKATTATGRVIIKLLPLKEFKGSQYDLELEDGDALNIPQTPSTVMVMGRVYNPNAILYSQGKPLDYYLEKVGGPAENADNKRMYLVKADGSVISRTQSGFWGFRWDTESKKWTSGGFLNTAVGPGDTVLVPEKYERVNWTREIRDWTQIFFQIAVAAGVIVALY